MVVEKRQWARDESETKNSQDPERCWNQADGSDDFRWEDGEDGWLA